MENRIHHKSVPLDPLTENEALNAIGDEMKKKASAHQIITLNIETYSHARRFEGFRKILEESWMVVNESYGLLAYSALHRPKLSKIPNGVYLAEKAVAVCAREDKKVVLLGSSERDRIKAMDTLIQANTTLRIDQVEGDYTFSSQADTMNIIKNLRRLDPDFVLMAGNEITAQRWIHEQIIRPQILPVVIGNFGGTIGKLAGNYEQWQPTEEEHRWYSFMRMNKHRNHQRKAVWRRGIINALVLAVEDSLKINS